MMYVITNNAEDNIFVIAGPMEWRPKYFADMISEETNTRVIITAGDEANVPFSPMQGIIIRLCDVVYEPIDSEVQHHEGPYITFEDDPLTGKIGNATATYKAADKHPVIIEEVLKNTAAAVRWNKQENSKIEVKLGSRVVTISTAKENRESLSQKYIVMDEDSVINWKFDNSVWESINKQEVLLILKKVDSFIQELFDEENNTAIQAKKATTASEYKEVFSKLKEKRSARGNRLENRNI